MIKIAIAGDFCPRDRVATLIDNGNFEYLLFEVRDYLMNYDYSVVNLEAPIVLQSYKSIKKDGPSLKCKKNVLDAIKFAGFDMVTLANNHINDYGAEGLFDTISLCKEHSIDFVGVGDNIEQASTIKYVEIKGENFAFINCCENEFSIADTNTPGSNPINPIQQYYKILEAKENAKYVVVITHGGHEHYQLPSPRMKELYRFFIDVGADAVINHHQHCICGYEIYKNKPIAYGIGNFCFDSKKSRDSVWNEGLIIGLSFEQGKVSMVADAYIQCDKKPTITFKDLKVNEIYKKLELQNRKIQDNKALKENFERFCKSRYRVYSLPFELYWGKILRTMYLRKILPALTTSHKKIFNRNMICCESHLDIVKFILNSENNA